MKPSVHSLIEGIPNLASHASVLHEIEHILQDPQSTLVDVASVIEKDPGLTARLLRLGNSAFYGFTNRLETVTDTINLIGLQQVQDLILASTVLKVFSGVSPELVTMESFWKHSLGCGVAARLLAMERKEPKPERFFVAGLLHDIGRMVLYSRASELARDIFEQFGQRPVTLREVELQVLTFDHSEIGAGLLVNWNYPPPLVNAVRYHHVPMAGGAYQLEASIVHLADHLANAMQLGTSGERLVPPLNPRAWERLNLNLDCLENLVEKTDAQMSAVEEAFLRG